MSRKDSPPDLHYDPPQWKLPLKEVGVKELPVLVRWVLGKTGKNLCRELYGIASITVNLPGEIRAVNMSRTISALKKVIEEKNNCRDPYQFLSEVSEKILKKHEYSESITAMIETRTEKNNQEIKFSIGYKKDEKKKEKKYIVTVEKEGITACPSARANYSYYEKTDLTSSPTHMQRALLKITIESGRKPLFPLEIVEIIDKSFNALPEAFLKRKSEYQLVKKAISNPIFTEDLARKAYSITEEKLRSNKTPAKIKIEVLSYESIHPFNIIAVVEGEVK